jgi:hypothetical protein
LIERKYAHTGILSFRIHCRHFLHSTDWIFKIEPLLALLMNQSSSCAGLFLESPWEASLSQVLEVSITREVIIPSHMQLGHPEAYADARMPLASSK